MSKEGIIPHFIPLEILAAFPPKAPEALDEEEQTLDIARNSLLAYCEKEKDTKFLWEQILIKP